MGPFWNVNDVTNLCVAIMHEAISEVDFYFSKIIVLNCEREGEIKLRYSIYKGPTIFTA